MDSSDDSFIPHPKLLEAIDRIEVRQDLVTFTPEEWNAQLNIG